MSVVGVLALLSGAASYLLTALVRRYALHHKVLDHPNERSSHSAPTPRGGGLAVLAGLGLSLIAGTAVGAIAARDATTLGLGTVVLGVVGWIDDHGGLRPRTRLAAHLAVAIWTLSMLGGLPSLVIGAGSIHLGVAGFVVGVIGIVWSINLFNFMDGIDGLAGSQALLIFGAAAALLFARGDRSLGTIALTAATACVGFLVWNWPPARIFLGDVGSGALGYLIAGLTIGAESHHSVPAIVFGILGGVFVADATVTLVRRLARGDRPHEAHRDHAYQRLTRAWGSHRAVTTAAAALTLALCGLGALAMHTPTLLIPCLLAAYAILAVLLIVVERYAPLNRVDA